MHLNSHTLHLGILRKVAVVANIDPGMEVVDHLGSQVGLVASFRAGGPADIGQAEGLAGSLPEDLVGILDHIHLDKVVVRHTVAAGWDKEAAGIQAVQEAFRMKGAPVRTQSFADSLTGEFHFGSLRNWDSDGRLENEVCWRCQGGVRDSHNQKWKREMLESLVGERLTCRKIGGFHHLQLMLLNPGIEFPSRLIQMSYRGRRVRRDRECLCFRHRHDYGQP